MLDWLGNALLSMVPPILVGLLFYVVMRSIFRADATERKVYAKIEAEERAKLGKATADAEAAANKDR